MRRVVFPCLAFCLAFLLLNLSCGINGHCEGPSRPTPLPDDLKIEPPGPGVTQPLASLSGTWQGELELC
jgi:hypothetical protein